MNLSQALPREKYKIKEFYLNLEKVGLKLKERDKNIFKAQLLDFNDDIDKLKFIHFVKNQSSKQVDCKIQGGLSKPATPRPVGNNTSMGKTLPDKEKETLSRSVEILKKQALEHRKERETFDKQLGNWKEKCGRLEREMKSQQNQVQSANQHLQSELKNNPVMQVLKDKVFQLEEE